MEAFGYEVAVVGATGCVGREVLQRIGEYIPIRKMHVFASLASTAEHIDVDGDELVVKGLQETGIPTDIRSSLHLVILCCPIALAKKWGPELAEEGIAVVDMTGGLGESIGYSLQGLSDREEDFQSHRMISLPSPSIAMMARIWQAVQTFKPIQMSAVINVSASRFGQQGIEELAKQVRGLLNFQDAPQSVFPDGLAFDILPSLEGLTDIGLTEEGAAHALADLTLLEQHRFRSRIQVAPIFSGISMHVQIALGENPMPENMTDVLTQNQWLTLQSTLPNLRLVSGASEVLVGRVQSNPWIQGIDLQLQADNVSLAVSNALSIAKQLHTQELI